MNVGIIGPRPSVCNKIEGTAEIAGMIVDNVIGRGHHVSVMVTLGFSMDVLRVLKNRGGLYDIYLWGPVMRITKKWMLDGDREFVYNLLTRASNVIVAGTRLSKKAGLAKRNRMFCSACDAVIVFSPGKLDGDLAEVASMARRLHVLRSRDEVESFNWDDL